jgi:hypothetical protein
VVRITSKPKDKAKDEEILLLSFLKRTKEGKYAQVDNSSIPYSRIIEERETIESFEEEFYYSIS